MYRQVPDWRQAGKVMLEGNPHFLALGVASVLLHMLIRAMRWGVLLSPAKPRISLKTLFSLTVVKYLVNLIPPRAGEVVASVLLARRENLGSARVIATSMFERILDLITLIVFAGLYFVLFAHRHAPPSERGTEILLALQSYSLKALAVSGLAVVVLWFLLRHLRPRAKSSGLLRRLLSQFLEGFRVLHEGGTLLRAVLLSVCIWITIAFQMWFIMRAYLETFPYSGSFLLMAITAIGMAIPTPGGIGGFHYFLSLGLVHFFYDYLSPHDFYSQVAGISNGAYIVSMLPLFLIGLVLLNREGLSWKSITTTESNPRAALDPGRVI